MSAFENVPQPLKEAVFTEIADTLLQQWIDSLADEGQYYLDHQIASMSGDEEFAKAFNKFYELTPEDKDYINV